MINIAIDPGHGMSSRRPGKIDTGATSFGVQEAQVCMQFASAVRWVAKNEYANVNVMLTRISDTDPAPLALRARSMKKAGARCFISLHCNSSLSPFSHGTEAFIRDSEDRKLADRLLPRICAAMGTTSRGVKDEAKSQHPRLAVLDFDGPACLIELAFLTHRTERQKLQDRERRIAVAQAILKTVEELYR